MFRRGAGAAGEVRGVFRGGWGGLGVRVWGAGYGGRADGVGCVGRNGSVQAGMGLGGNQTVG